MLLVLGSIPEVGTGPGTWRTYVVDELGLMNQRIQAPLLYGLCFTLLYTARVYQRFVQRIGGLVSDAAFTQAYLRFSRRLLP